MDDDSISNLSLYDYLMNECNRPSRYCDPPAKKPRPRCTTCSGRTAARTDRSDIRGTTSGGGGGGAGPGRTALAATTSTTMTCRRDNNECGARPKSDGGCCNVTATSAAGTGARGGPRPCRKCCGRSPAGTRRVHALASAVCRLTCAVADWTWDKKWHFAVAAASFVLGMYYEDHCQWLSYCADSGCDW